MPMFQVVVIRNGRERDYRDFWDKGVKENSAGEVLHSGLVGFTVEVKAKNLKDALAKVSAMHPGHSIAHDHSSRIGK